MFLHEHPATAASWDRNSMTDLMADPDICAVAPHQCEFGLATPGPDGSPVPALKPTKWISNSKHMIFGLSRRCSKQHQHQYLTARRTEATEFYPVELCVEILRGMRDTADANFHHDDEDDILMNHAGCV